MQHRILLPNRWIHATYFPFQMLKFKDKFITPISSINVVECSILLKEAPVNRHSRRTRQVWCNFRLSFPIPEFLLPLEFLNKLRTCAWICQCKPN